MGPVVQVTFPNAAEARGGAKDAPFPSGKSG